MITWAAPRRWARTTVGLLVTVWLLSFPLMLWWLFRIGMQGWANSYSDDPARSAEIDHSTSMATLTVALLAVGGPAVIALVAFAGSMYKIGKVFAVLAVTGLVLAVALTAGSSRPAAPADPSPTICQEHSGGDTRCPGG